MIAATRTELRRIFSLSWPLIGTQLGQMVLGVTDIFMLGRVGTAEVAAATLGHIWIWGTFVLGLGLVLGMDPIATQAVGRRDHSAVAAAVIQGTLFAIAISVPLTAAWIATEPVLRLLGQDPRLSSLAHEYVIFQAFGNPPFLLVMALRQYLQAQGIVRPILWATLAAAFVNIFFNEILIFGHLGFPPLGIIGASIATGCTRTVLLVTVIVIVVRRLYRERENTRIGHEALDLASYRRMIAFGIPIALQFAAEVWAFQTAGIFAGWLSEYDPDQLAAHGIVLNLASLTFMVPLGISLGTVTRVGNLIGEGRYHRAQRAARVAFALGIGFATISALTFGLGRQVLPELITKDRRVIGAAAAILPIAAAFQWFDGTQVIGSGVLRAMGRTRPAAVFNLLGYYALALPLGYFLAFELGYGLKGIWWGLALGLGIVASSLVAWVAKMGPASLRAPRDMLRDRAVADLSKAPVAETGIRAEDAGAGGDSQRSF